MSKLSRRERRRLAEQGKSAPRRAAPASMPHGAAIEPRERVVAAPTEPSLQTAVRPGAKIGEYAHVKTDLLRIALLATALFGGMIALRFILPQ